MENKTENFLSIPTQDNNELDICEEIKKSIEAIILYRSLYILKKKFQLKKPKIRSLYNSFNIDKNSNVAQYNSYQVNIENFVIICETIFKECNILLTTLTNPKDIFLSTIFLNMNRKMNEMNGILNDIKTYITEQNNSLVKKYNNLFYNKKIKPNLIKNILENKQKQSIKKTYNYNSLKSYNDNNQMNINYQNNEKNEINIVTIEKEKEIKNETNQDEEEEEIQRTIVEYNRKGKIIRTFNRIANDNLTLSINKENEKNEKKKNLKNIIKEKIQYFQINNNNDFVGSYMQNILEKSTNFEVINEKEEYNYENDEKNKTVSMYKLIDIENNINYNNILYIETLPLIIADYMQQFPFYCIIETESDLANELNILFDKELIEKMNNYEEALKFKNENYITKELYKYEKSKTKIENNIKIYENLINEKKSKGDNTVILENMLEKLLAKNIVIQDKISQLKSENNNNNNNTIKYELNTKNDYQDANITNNMELNDISRYTNIGVKLSESNNNKTLNNYEYNKSKIKLSDIGKEKMSISQLNTNLKYKKSINTKPNVTTDRTDNNTKISNSVKDIFNFYSRQHNSVGSNGLFADVEKNMEHLTTSEFSKFCVEFNIPITRQKCNDIYKKSLSLSPSKENRPQLMNLEAFIYSLKYIANNIHQNKLSLLQRNIQQEKSKLNSLEMKQVKIKEMEKYNNSLNLNTNNNTNKNKNTFDKGEFYFECEKKKYMNSIFNLENKYNNEKNKTEDEIMNNFYVYIGINSNNEYKSKLKGFLLPFRTREKKKSLTRSKNSIWSRLESEIREANKIFIMRKNEQKKLVLSKEVLEKQLLFKEKKKLFKIKNERLHDHIEKKINKKYADKLSDFRNELKRKKLEKIEMKRKEELDKKNIISWNKLEDFDVSNLEIDENEKKLFIESDNSDEDEEIINRMSNYKKRLNKNNSALDLTSKNSLLLPPITKKINLEKDNSLKDDLNSNEFKEIINNDYNMKKEETNNFGNLSAITNNNQNFNYD